MREPTNRLAKPTFTLLIGFALLVLPLPLNAQDGSQLTAASALKMMELDAGKWSGVRKDYSDGEVSGPENKVVVINRIEGGEWLYFQIAERKGEQVKFTKGTLEFDQDEGKFVRRWFENGDPEIKRATPKFDSQDKTLSFSFMVPDSKPGPDDEEPQDIRFTTVLSSPDADTRVIRVYSQSDPEALTEGDLVSELELARVKQKAKPASSSVLQTKKVASKTPAAKPKQPVKKPEPKPEPVTHTLRVTVLVGSSRLDSGQKPDLAISPDDGVKVKRSSNDTFEFTGLKAGEEYTVEGSYKLETGFGLNTEGKTTAWAIPKDSPTKRTKTKVLSLK